MALPLPQGDYSILDAVNEITNASKGRLQNELNRLQNQYYGPNIESQIAERNALTQGYNIANQYAPERLGLANEYQKLINKYYAPEKESQIQSRAAKIQQQKVVSDIINKILSGEDLTQANVANPPEYNKNYAQNNIQNIPPVSTGFNQLNENIPISNQNNIPPMSQMQGVPSQGGINYPKAAVLNHLLGLGSPKIIDVNGKQIAVTPFGNIPVAEGLTPSQEAYQKGKGKYTAESYGKDVDTYNALQNQGVALDEMVNALDNPEFYNVTGPVSSFLKRWTGTPEQKELLGSLQTASGEIALQIAPGLKGAFTGRDQTLINTIKANPNTDFPEVFIGKLKAQKLISEVLKERARRAAYYKDNGISPLEANERAARETPLSKFKPIVDNLIKPKKITIKNLKTGEKKSVSVDEARKLGVKI